MNDVKFSQNWAYRMSLYKFEKIKKYLIENLFKNFITLNKTLYFSSMLFAMKVNKNLRFCVDYRRFNVMIKWNRYFLLLIKEIIEKIIECKYFIKLNIIVVFNKLRMHSDNENYTTFIIILSVYKYRVLSFKLINDLNSFQQYINDALWKFLNDFCQVYFDDILIYNYIKKKHIRHVRLMLDKLRKIDLQMNIKKCKFNVEKIVFLNVIISRSDLRMNLKKMKIIVNWIISINLKEVQNFIRFANFYRRFIKNFSKIIRFLMKLTRKDQFFVWNETCFKVFQKFKNWIIFAFIFRHFDSKKQTMLKIDSFD